ncbi:MAG TPA: MauE/DoxX family redox-associated membrane protein, partial [Pyrinomonadaceae bacterium]|nr:MauE/DoxX family redox-associated membrane protein [Pyrinomonadaceae bacterium]
MVRFSKTLSNQTDTQRITRLKIALALAFLCGFLLSPKLWLSTRAYPLAPVAKFLHAPPFPLDYLAFALLLLLLIGIVLFARPRKLIVAFVALVVLVCLWDQTRWQPWCYQYVFMSLALACYSWRVDDGGGRESALNACAFVVAGIYFWSGLQKVNPLFTGELFPSLVEPYARHLPASFGAASRWVAPLVPLAEVGVGLGLLSRKFRTHAVFLALVLHLSVLVLFVPVRRNTIVWPWNAAMICFVVLLFWRRQQPALWRHALAGKWQVLTRLSVLLFWVMPA